MATRIVKMVAAGVLPDLVIDGLNASAVANDDSTGGTTGGTEPEPGST